MIKTYDFERHCHVSRLSRKKKKHININQDPDPNHPSRVGPGALGTTFHFHFVALFQFLLWIRCG
jgi:hypothetical protein